MFMLIKAFAKPSGGGRGTVVRDAGQRRRGAETMSDYYRRTGVSMLGASNTTRGRAGAISNGRARGRAGNIRTSQGGRLRGIRNRYVNYTTTQTRIGRR